MREKEKAKLQGEIKCEGVQKERKKKKKHMKAERKKKEKTLPSYSNFTQPANQMLSFCCPNTNEYANRSCPNTIPQLKKVYSFLAETRAKLNAPNLRHAWNQPGVINKYFF